MKGEATRINLAGKLRYMSFEAGWLLDQTLEVQSEEQRKNLVLELEYNVGSYEKILRDLKLGNKEFGFETIEHENILLLLNEVMDEWNETFKPLLLNTRSSYPESMLSLHNLYDSKIKMFVDKIDNVVHLLEEDYEEKIQAYEYYVYHIIVFFFLGSLFIVFYIKYSIVKPIRILKDASLQVRNGNLEVELDIRSRDEIGSLADNFNKMNCSLRNSFNRNTKLLVNSKSLFEASKLILANLQSDEILNIIIQKAQSAMGSKYAALSIFDKNGGYEHFIPAGFDPDISQTLIRRHGLPTGKGLLSLSLKMKKIVRVEKITKHPDFMGFPDGHPLMTTLLDAPIMVHGDVIGRMYFADKKNGEIFTHEDEELAESFTTIVALTMSQLKMSAHVKTLASFPEMHPFPVLECDLNCNITYVNSAVQKLIEKQSITTRDLLPPELQETLFEVDELTKQLKYFEITIGNIIFGEYIQILPNKKGARIYAYDITARKLVEKKLKTSEEQYRILVTEINDGIFILDQTGLITYSNKTRMSNF